jgi:SAM-dependent methyltransferase
MEWVACNLCGSTRHTPVYQMADPLYPGEERFTIVECAQCGLGFVNPRPTRQEMAKYYPPQYYQEGFERNLAHHQRRYRAEAGFLRDLEKPGGSRKLLDVGCANGDFPRYMKSRGWTVEGVEVSTASRPIADFPVYAVPFPEIPVREPRYDAVTAWAVIEHVHDPRAHFRKAAQVLKKGGRLVFLVTNFRSLASRHLFLEDAPRHLYFFTLSTVRQYLRETGFELERASFRGNIFEMPPRNWLHYFIRTRLQRRKFLYEDLPLSWQEFVRHEGLRPGLGALLKFAYRHPVTFLDRALLPMASCVEILGKNYGIATYVARAV